MMEREAKTPALKTEEAALLPAMNRQCMTGGAALAAVLQKTKPAAQRGRKINRYVPGGKHPPSRKEDRRG